MHSSSRNSTPVKAVALLLLLPSQCQAFTIPSSSITSAVASQSSSNRITPSLFAQDDGNKSSGTLFFAEETADETTAAELSSPSPPKSSSPKSSSPTQLFDSSTLAEANDALASVGWAGVAPMQGDGEMTSEDPFVKQIDDSIRGEMGVGLDELLNPAKVCDGNSMSWSCKSIYFACLFFMKMCWK